MGSTSQEGSMGRVICDRCRHPRSLHRGGCTAPSCHAGPDRGSCPAFMPEDARTEQAPVTPAVQAGPVPPLMVDIRGAMGLLRLGRCTVLGLADSGELTKLRFGKSVRYSVAEIQDLVRRKRYEAQASGGHRQAS